MAAIREIGLENLPTAEPAEVGLSAGRLARIGPVIDDYVARRLIPGAVTMVARHGRIAHFEVRGLRHLARGTEMTRDTIFRIASMTKPVTSVALMTLYEKGAFQLSDPISRWLPAFEKMEVEVAGENGDTRRVPAERAVNVRHVLTHTAGLATSRNPRTAKRLAEVARFRSRDETIGDFVDRLATLPLQSEPGKVWDYSRATCVVGRLVEVMSGRTLAEYFQEHVFDPLGMRDTHFYLPEEKLDRFAAAYGPAEDGGIREIEPPDPSSYWLSKPGRYYMGSGGLVSTAADYFKFADMLLQGGRREGVRILSRKTVELMTRDQIGDRWVWLAGNGYGFGLGFGVVKDRGRTHALPSEGSYSWGGAFCTHWWNDPVEKLFGMVLTQVRPYGHLNLRQDLQTLATQAIDD